MKIMSTGVILGLYIYFETPVYPCKPYQILYHLYVAYYSLFEIIILLYTLFLTKDL
jgi:hypothetical protein